MKYWICVIALGIVITGCERTQASPARGDTAEEGSFLDPASPDDISKNNKKSDLNVMHGEKDVSDDARGIDEATQFFETRVAWPEFDISRADKPVYAIESGSNGEGAWFEGKGYFRGTTEQFVRDMNEPLIMGPSNVTQALSRRNALDDETKHHYDLHVEMDYVFTIEFDLTVDIDVRPDGIHYESHKTNGTSVIKRIDEIIEIHKVSDGWFGIAFQSRYDALVVKEKETREHFEALFARWSGESLPTSDDGSLERLSAEL